MRFYSDLSDDERDEIATSAAGGRWGHCPGARSGETHLQGAERNALPSGGYSPLHAAGAYQLRRRREAILEREAALRLFVVDRLAEGWTPEQYLRLVENLAMNRRLRPDRAARQSTPSSIEPEQMAEALWRHPTRRHKRRRRVAPDPGAMPSRSSFDR